MASAFFSATSVPAVRQFDYDDANRMHAVRHDGVVAMRYLYNAMGERVHRAGSGIAMATLEDEGSCNCHKHFPQAWRYDDNKWPAPSMPIMSWVYGQSQLWVGGRNQLSISGKWRYAPLDCNWWRIRME